MTAIYLNIAMLFFSYITADTDIALNVDDLVNWSRAMSQNICCHSLPTNLTGITTATSPSGDSKSTRPELINKSSNFVHDLLVDSPHIRRLRANVNNISQTTSEWSSCQLHAQPNIQAPVSLPSHLPAIICPVNIFLLLYLYVWQLSEFCRY